MDKDKYKFMRDMSIEAIKSRNNKARQTLQAMCRGKHKFTMHIPVDLEHDTDIIFNEALTDSEYLVKCVESLDITLDRLRGLLREAEEQFRKHLWGAYSCPKNDKAEAFVDRLAAALKED